MDDKADLIFLDLCQVLGMAQQTEPCDVRRTVGVVFMHQASSYKTNLNTICCVIFYKQIKRELNSNKIRLIQSPR